MNAFFATVNTDYDTYYIDYKPANQYNNRFAVSSNRKGAVYVENVQDALDLIGYYDDQAIEQALLQSELDHNS